MKFFICALALVAAAYAAPPEYGNTPYYPQGLTKEGQARIVEYNQDQREDGSFQWGYKTENGIAAEETNVQQAAPPSGEPAQNVRGSYSYTAPEGIPIVVTYEAGPDGFVAKSDAIPVAPPIPEEILRSLAWNAAHPEEEAQWDPAYKGVPQPIYTQGRQ